MSRVCIICEGQTEKAFVDDCIKPLLAHSSICIHTDSLQRLEAINAEFETLKQSITVKRLHLLNAWKQFLLIILTS